MAVFPTLTLASFKYWGGVLAVTGCVGGVKWENVIFVIGNG